MRQTDCAYRYGGEEFLVLLAGVNEVEASHAAERIRAAVAARAIEHLDNEPGCVTISIGLIVLPAGIELHSADAIKSADAALYAAKQTGRNRVCSASVGEPAAQSLSA
jgi:diguanylate cyclase